MSLQHRELEELLDAESERADKAEHEVASLRSELEQMNLWKGVFIAEDARRREQIRAFATESPEITGNGAGYLLDILNGKA